MMLVFRLFMTSFSNYSGHIPYYSCNLVTMQKKTRNYRTKFFKKYVIFILDFGITV